MNNPLYPLEEVEVDPLFRIMWMSHPPNPLGISTYDIKGCFKNANKQVPNTENYIEKLVTEMKKRWDLPFHCASYPMRNIAFRSIGIYNKNLKNGGEKTFEIPNHCCSADDCPQVRMTQIYLDIIDDLRGQ